MIPYYGDYPEDHTEIRIPFNTFSSDDPSASVTITDLADADIEVHADGDTTQIATDGASVIINFAGETGSHMILIDSSVDAAYTTATEYAVKIVGTTIDGATVNAWIGAFSIERAGGALAILKALVTTVGTAGAGLSDLGGMSTGMKAQVNVEVDGALDTALSELSQGVPTATPTMRTGLMLLYMALRNKLDVATSGTDTLEIHNDAGTRIAQKLLTDAGGDYSEAKMTSGA